MMDQEGNCVSKGGRSFDNYYTLSFSHTYHNIMDNATKSKEGVVTLKSEADVATSKSRPYIPETLQNLVHYAKNKTNIASRINKSLFSLSLLQASTSQVEFSL